jgi:hypothetical protein
MLIIAGLQEASPHGDPHGPDRSAVLPRLVTPCGRALLTASGTIADWRDARSTRMCCRRSADAKHDANRAQVADG